MMARSTSSRRRDATRCASSNEIIWAIVSADGRASAPGRLGPRDASVRLENFRAHVELVAVEDILRRTRRDVAQHLAVPADELHPILLSGRCLMVIVMALAVT